MSSTAIPFRSHLCQLMQNYFDEKDVRVRRGRYPVDAQLLNSAAQQMEMSGLRLQREIDATTLHNCPANIDHEGWYWKQRLPDSINLYALTHTVVATIGGQQVTLTPYDDQLPIPTGVSVNNDISPIPLTTATLFELYGIGDTTTQSWSCQRVAPFTPQIADRISFWVDGPGYYGLNIMVRITGQRAPVPAWSDAQTTTSETVTIANLGWAQSKFAWASILQIQVLNLPVGVSLSAYNGLFSLPMFPDQNRPYTNHAYRDVLFARSWSYNNGLLLEQYMESDYAGWRYANSYIFNGAPITGIAVEPNTWGMYIASGTTLYYMDRREPLPPVGLLAPAISREPYYGIEVFADEANLTPVKFAVIHPVAYSNAASADTYRYLVVTPDGTTYALTPDGFYTEYTRNSGWRNGTPPTLSIPLPFPGTYIFYLQAIGPDGVIVQDGTPFNNSIFTPLATLDLSGIVSSIQGLAFDDVGQLWVWTGTEAFPLQFQYDAYLIDAGSQAIYLTDYADGLIVDGIVIGSAASSPNSIYVNGVYVGSYYGTITIGGQSI